MEGPLRFRCPPEFEAVTPSGGAGLGAGVLGGPSTELWLIRAPADFCPESLEGCSVPLAGTGQLQPPGAGQGQLYRLQGGTGGTGDALLLAPATPSGPLACAPPLHGCLTIAKSFGPPPPPPGTPVPTPASPLLPAKRKKKKKKEEEKTMKELPEVPQVPMVPEVSTPQRALPSERGQCQLAPPQDPEEESEVARKKKKKKKKHKEEQLE